MQSICTKQHPVILLIPDAQQVGQNTREYVTDETKLTKRERTNTTSLSACIILD